MLESEPRASQMPAKLSAINLCPQPWLLHLTGDRSRYKVGSIYEVITMG